MSEPLISPEPDPEHALRSRRFIQIACFTEIALVIRTGISIAAGDWEGAWTLSAGLTAILLCFWLNRKGMTEAANLLLLGSLTIVISFMLWIGEGIFDVAILAYPTILIMSGLLLKPRYFFAQFILILGAVTFITYTELAGYHPFQATGTAFVRLTDTALILTVTVASVWVMTHDLHQVLQQLKQEIVRAQTSQASLTFLAQHDALTNLPNRLLGRELMEQAIAQARRNGQRIALLFVDLDNFKTVNDSLGHTAGDTFLVEVAQRLSQSVRATDIVSRQGGDEFLVALTEIGDLDAINTAATNILTRLTASFSIKDLQISTSCSIGIAVFPDDGNDFETLLRLSDIGMYQAKESGRNMFRFYDEKMNSSIAQNLHLTSSLRQALANKEFVLHYQPVVELHSGRLIGVEALIRWQHPERGMVPPLDFIPAAERSGLIVDIGEWVINEACQQMTAWRAAGAPEFIIAVNISTVQFRRGNIEQVVANALALSGLNPACLELELTESTLIQNAEEFIKTLQRLKTLGIRISIDDFGTGYSNLSYLQRFDVDKLKIDQSFVRRLGNGTQDRAIVNAIIQMAKSLNLTTTAEGIEDENTRRQLIELGCDQGQGYLFAKPQAASIFALQLHLKTEVHAT
jgi:diguanylate cyclase (GGDEF)-like protein